MIGMKEAVEIAKREAGEILGETVIGLEEIDREKYNGARDVWSITLSLPPRTVRSDLAIQVGRIQYRRFLIDVETGELVAMKLREVA